jgi:hypothetical protein
MNDLEFQLLKDVLARKGAVEIPCVGRSMEPVLFEGAQLKVEPLLADQEPQRFRLYVFRDQNRLVCHYFYGCSHFAIHSPKTYHFRGLANKFDDFPVPRDQILGKVVNIKMDLLNQIRVVLQFFLIR